MSSAGKISFNGVAGITFLSSVAGAVAAICENMAGATVGAYAADGHAVTIAGAAAMGTVGGIFLAGAASGIAFAVKKAGGNNLAGAAAAFALCSMTVGAGLTGFETGKAVQSERNTRDAAVSVPVGRDLRRALDAHPDKGRVANEINNFVQEKLRRERSVMFNLCVQNPDNFRAKGIECGIYATPAPAP